MVEYQVTVSNIQPDVLFVLCSILVVNSYALVQRIFVLLAQADLLVSGPFILIKECYFIVS